MRRPVLWFLMAVLFPALLVPAPPGAAAAKSASITIIQAVPGARVDVTVDGRDLVDDALVGDLLGPFELAPGSHEISFTGDDLSVDSTLELDAGSAQDVVLHLPAEVGGAAIVHSYSAPDGAIGPGKARVMLAHTATVAPADVKVDGQTVFTNIANGEFADADVPAGSISVALLPSGTNGKPILGPLDVSLEAGTLSMIYAYGSPREGSMNVIAHITHLAADGSVQPSRIATGSAGLVATPVTTFEADDAFAPWTIAILGLLAAAAAALGAVAHRRSRPSVPRHPAR